MKVFDYFEICKLVFSSSCSLNALMTVNGEDVKSSSGMQAVYWARSVLSPQPLHLHHLFHDRVSVFSKISRRPTHLTIFGIYVCASFHRVPNTMHPQRRRMGQIGQVLHEGHCAHTHNIIQRESSTTPYREEACVYDKQDTTRKEEVVCVSLLINKFTPCLRASSPLYMHLLELFSERGEGKVEQMLEIVVKISVNLHPAFEHPLQLLNSHSSTLSFLNVRGAELVNHVCLSCACKRPL